MPSPKPNPKSGRQKRIRKTTTPAKKFPNVPPGFIQEDYPHIGGRPTKLTEDVVHKLVGAWMHDYTMAEAASYAKVSVKTLENWVAKYDWLLGLREDLKNDPVMRARRTWVAALDHDVKEAREYLERKRRSEFSKHTVLSDPDGKNPFEGLGDALQRMRDGAKDGPDSS